MTSTMDEFPREVGEKKYKKKKKQSLVQKAKKYGKKGQFGRGKQIEKETYDYFVRVLENMNKMQRDGDFEKDEESKDLFVANVFQQTEDQELDLCCNQLASRVVETLLPHGDVTVWRRFMKALSEDLRVIATDPFASHIIEKLLTLNVFHFPTDCEDEFAEFSSSWVIKVVKFSVNNAGDFMADPYASHILRTCLGCAAGIKISDDILRSKRSRVSQRQNEDHLKNKSEDNSKTRENLLSKEMSKEILESAAFKISTLEDFESALTFDLSASVIQSLIVSAAEAIPKSEAVKKFRSDLIPKLKELKNPDKEENGADHDDLFDSTAASRILESLIASSLKSSEFTKIYETFFDGKLKSLSVHEVGNFTVQRLLESIKEKEFFEKIYEAEFDESIGEICENGNFGVVLALAQSCNRLSAKQAHFLVALMKALNCYDPPQAQDKLALLLSRMARRDKVDNLEALSVNLHGSLIIQEILRFNKPIKMVKSLLEMDPSALAKLLSDPRGSHIADSFVESPTVGEKSRDGLVKTLNGQLFTMATSKHGSRSVQSIWGKSSAKAKESMAKELSASASQLNSNQFGKYVSQQMNLELYKRSRDEWKQFGETVAKKEKLFQEILGDIKKTSKNSTKVKEAKVKKDEEEEVKKEKSSSFKRKLEEENENDKTEDQEKAKKKKKKKQKAKSYLDDL